MQWVDDCNGNGGEEEKELGIMKDLLYFHLVPQTVIIVSSVFHFPHYFCLCVLLPDRIKSLCVEGTITSVWRPFSSGCSASFLTPSQCSTPTCPTRPSTKQTHSVSLNTFFVDFIFTFLHFHFSFVHYESHTSKSHI